MSQIIQIKQNTWLLLVYNVIFILLTKSWILWKIYVQWVDSLNNTIIIHIKHWLTTGTKLKGVTDRSSLNFFQSICIKLQLHVVNCLQSSSLERNPTSIMYVLDMILNLWKSYSAYKFSLLDLFTRYKAT